MLFLPTLPPRIAAHRWADWHRPIVIIGPLDDPYLLIEIEVNIYRKV